MLPRPSETISATVGSILGAAFIIIGYVSGWNPPAEVAGAIVLLVSWVATAVTWVVSKRQRDPAADLTSTSDGTVVST